MRPASARTLLSHHRADPVRCVRHDPFPGVAAPRFDAAVSALMLNFVPDPAAVLAEMRRAVRPGGAVALYVWDYAGRMEMMRHFWDAAAAIDPGANAADEGRRFPICEPHALESAAS